ncbi:iron complex outermembrane receptor protein [Pedobacter cryoconitis]|uniref:Iron complex outermembrane receptor protein n=1 Tax=Pedobacter cryoconitis TaxID=188932 RepID=A0A7W8ZLA8_9SPHI|nr:TonB-dependent receptor [Pedobacter cryoconitis]MBB5636106.1 iron complex outermembrane receptor protein [Pedobacter cryoconitis]
MKQIITLILLTLTINSFSQIKQDTAKKLEEVVIRPYFSTQPLLRATGAVALLNKAALDQQPNSSLVSAMNTIAGVRMEERSPGSYRLSIRGSLLRSPFGVRNVKIYFDEFPLTDAGGNTYLNALDLSAIGNIQLLKGPQSSIYGANSGGVVLIAPNTIETDSTKITFNLTGGSFGLFHENLNLSKRWKNYSFSFNQSYQRSDGYRDHSGMDRKYFQLHQKWAYSAKANLTALLFYSDLQYETPGGLTAAEYELNPRLSRPAAGAIRSAAEQQAGIYSKTSYAGITNSWQINKQFKHVVSVFTSYTDFKNPFLTNYEHRKESTFGIRTYVEYFKKTEDISWRFNLGLEASKTHSNIDNSDNNYGTPANLQASDKLNAATNFSYAHLNVDIFRKLFVELSASANLYHFSYKRLAPVLIPEKNKNFELQFMPRAALSYLLTKNLSLRGSVSRGYSPPTLAEIRASDNVININLQPESGWNYETGIRYQTANKRITLDLNGFYYHLKNAIVRRLNENATEYFINAGGTKQLGLETSISAILIKPNTTTIIRALSINTAYTLSHFKFDHYLDRTIDLSGKDLTGVPKNVIVTSIDLQLPKRFYIFLQYNYTAKLPLTDANTAYASAYHLVQSKIGWKELRIANTQVEIFAGADNLLNQKYSLGNDLNAAGGRYFNAAATRSFYGGLNVHF